MQGFAQAMGPPQMQRQPPAQQAQPQQQRQTQVSPYAQSLFGGLASQVAAPQGQPSPEQPMVGATPQMAAQNQLTTVIPYLNLLSSLPRTVQPGMQSSLAQILSQILASGMGFA